MKEKSFKINGNLSEAIQKYKKILEKGGLFTKINVNETMKKHIEIIEIITKYLKENPEQRFGQALFNLAINEFENKSGVQNEFQLRDIYNDSDDEIIERMKKRIEMFERQKQKK